MAKELWACKDHRLWDLARRSVERARSHNVKKAQKGLVELDRWWTDDLPPAMARRSPPHMTKDELVKLVEWKLVRGKWRPQLLNYAKQQQEDAVVEASGAACKELARVRGRCPDDLEPIAAALTILTKLRGVGPATASGILAAGSVHVPYMSDEALEATLGTRDYTVKECMALTEALQKQASELNSAQEEEAAASAEDPASTCPKPQKWTAGAVERALWAAEVVGFAAITAPSAAGDEVPAATAAGSGTSKATALGVKQARQGKGSPSAAAGGSKRPRK